MFKIKQENEVEHLDGSTAYYLGLIQGVGIGVTSTMILGGFAVLILHFI